MISANDIKNLVSGGEGFNVEFKHSVPSKVREISEEVCAFANAAGGIVLLGVDDSNQTIGINIDNLKRSAIQNSLNEITPNLNCLFHEIKLDDKAVFVIEVPSGVYKPYVLSGAIYIRIGPNTQKLTTLSKCEVFFSNRARCTLKKLSVVVFKLSRLNKIFSILSKHPLH